MHDYERFAETAHSQLSSHIYQNVNSLMAHLIQNAEATDYEDELRDCSVIEEVEENQYRMDLWTDEVRIVLVEDINQVDHQQEPAFVVTHEEFYCWAKGEGHADKDVESGADLLPYLASQVADWHSSYTLLDEGGEAEMAERKVYEHWLVDSCAKRQLESVGERVVEVFDMNIWCRTCTGQTLWYDGCMQQLGERYLNSAQ